MTAKKKTAPRGIEDILAAAQPRETEVTLCLAGDLAADADRITAELDALRSYTPSSLADVDPRIALTAELDKVRASMAAAETTFRFRCLPRLDYSDLLAAHSPREGKKEVWNLDTLPTALIAASCIEPVMTLEQADELLSLVNEAGRNALFNAAWQAHHGAVQVPTSRAVSPNLST